MSRQSAQDAGRRFIRWYALVAEGVDTMAAGIKRFITMEEKMFIYSAPKMIRTIFCLLSILVTAPVFSAVAAVYYVDQNHLSPDGEVNTGTEASPWKTIQEAADRLREGDTVYIKAGTYTEMVLPANSGTPEKPITYSNYGSDQVIIDAENGTRVFAIGIDGKSWLHFHGLTLTGATKEAAFYIADGSSDLVLDQITATNSRYGFLLHGESAPVSNIIIRNCVAANNADHGFFLYKKIFDTQIGPGNLSTENNVETSAHGLEISTDFSGNPENGARRISVFGNEISWNGTQGIRTWNAEDVTIRYNYLHHNGATGIQIEDGSRNILIEGNLSEDNAQSCEYETGAWVDGAVNVTVQNNILRRNNIGLLITSSDRCLVRNNLIFRNNRGVPHTINSSGLGVNSSSSNVIVVHNTLYRNGTADSQLAGIAYGVSPTGQGIIKNNIISETTAPLDFFAGVHTYSADYNVYFNTRALAVSYLGTHMNWTQYQTASGQEAHSLTLDPAFMAPDSLNFQLQTDSPVRDAGDYLTQTTEPGSGTIIPLEDTRFFSAGVLGSGATRILVVGNAPAQVLEVNDANRTVTVDRSLVWSDANPVAYPFEDDKPDPGAFETGDSAADSGETGESSCFIANLLNVAF